jgi:hypothetical protein
MYDDQNSDSYDAVSCGFHLLMSAVRFTYMHSCNLLQTVSESPWIR